MHSRVHVVPPEPSSTIASRTVVVWSGIFPPRIKRDILEQSHNCSIANGVIAPRYRPVILHTVELVEAHVLGISAGGRGGVDCTDTLIAVLIKEGEINHHRGVAEI